MDLTTGILLDFFDDQGCIVLSSPNQLGEKYKIVRIYYKGIPMQPNCLYLIDDAEFAQIDSTFDKAAFCLVTREKKTTAECDFVVSTAVPIYQLFDRLQELTEKLNEWDHTLSGILLRDGSLQEVLDCSESILRAPCFLQDSNFYLLASSGTVTEKENQFFHDTLRTGRAPSGLFTQLLSMSPSEQPYSSPKAISSAVKELFDHRILITDCCVNGIAALHFCLYCGDQRRKGLPDLIIHLMQRLEAGPSIRRLTSKSTDLHDALFSKVIDSPDDSEFTNICSVLGLFRYRQFTAVCIDFAAQSDDVDSKMTKLRALHSKFWFFRYEKQLFALVGSNSESKEADLSAQRSLLQQLRGLGAAYGKSLDHFGPKALKIACQQASDALHISKEAETSYADVLVQQMITNFYEVHPFQYYCPESFLQMLKEDETTGISNLELLFTFLSNNCNATAVSRILHMHRNNVLYRIEKIKAKYHFDLSDGKMRLQLQILAAKAMMDLGGKEGKR